MTKNKALKTIFAILILVIIASIVRFLVQDCPAVNPARISGEIVSQVWPPPEVNLPLKCYLIPDRPIIYLEGDGIGASLVTVEIDENFLTQPDVPIENRVRLIVNGEIYDATPSIQHMQELLICDDNQTCIQTGRPATINLMWKPSLFIGEHEIVLQVETDTNRTLEYRWAFSITW